MFYLGGFNEGHLGNGGDVRGVDQREIGGGFEGSQILNLSRVGFKGI